MKLRGRSLVTIQEKVSLDLHRVVLGRSVVVRRVALLKENCDCTVFLAGLKSYSGPVGCRLRLFTLWALPVVLVPNRFWLRVVGRSFELKICSVSPVGLGLKMLRVVGCCFWLCSVGCGLRLNTLLMS